MKTLLKIVYWVAGIIALLIIIAYLLPKTYKVERSITMKANPELIYSLTSDFTKWHLWVKWTKELDSTAVFELAGEPATVGASWKWTGKILGNGEMVLAEVIPGQLVKYDLAFDGGKYKSVGKIVIENQGDSTKVSWFDEGNLGYNPINRYFGLFMDRMMGPDFEKGLAKLKTIAEERNQWPKIEIAVLPAQTAIMVKDSAGPKEYAAVMGKAYEELYSYVKSARLTPSGPPFATYIRWDSATMFSVMNICLPVLKADKGKGRITAGNFPEQKVVQAIYFGAYDKMEPAYKAVEQFIKESGLTEAGAPMEIYVTDPMTEKDISKLETHIVFPVKEFIR